MKPIAAYALGIDYALVHYSKMVMDAPIMARDPNKRDPESGTPIKDWPTNYGDKVRNEKIPIVSAIAESTNTVAAQVGMWVSRDAMFEFLEETLQISSLVPEDRDLGPLVLGSQTYGMSAYELAGAYAMFGGEQQYGVFTTLHSYSKVTDAKGNIVLEPEVMPIQAVEQSTGYVMNRLLYNVVHSGTYPGGASPTAGGMALEGEMESVGKTGTTSNDNDRWFVGLTPYYVTAVWWGYDNTTPDKGYTFYRKWSANARTNIPVNVWKALMEPIHAELPYKEFPERPEGVVETTFCTISGGLAQPGCPAMGGYYTDFGLPETCPGHGDAEEEGAEAAEP
jgi:penicillin-binding protein 1A